MTSIIAYVATLVVFVAVDLVWLRLVMVPAFRADVPTLLAVTPNTAAAVAFYVAFCLGLVHFAVLDAIANRAVLPAVREGALVGLLSYGTYELTNMATLRDWTWRLVAMDMTWGAFLCALSAGAGAWVALSFARA